MFVISTCVYYFRVCDLFLRWRASRLFARTRKGLVYLFFFRITAVSKPKTVAWKSYRGIYIYIDLCEHRSCNLVYAIRTRFLSLFPPTKRPLTPPFYLPRVRDYALRWFLKSITSNRFVINIVVPWSRKRATVNVFALLSAGWRMNVVAVTGTRASFVNISDKMSTTTDVSDLADVPKEGTPIFLQTRAAQVIAGIFVWIALFLTCQQVSTIDRIRHLLA